MRRCSHTALAPWLGIFCYWYLFEAWNFVATGEEISCNFILIQCILAVLKWSNAYFLVMSCLYRYLLFCKWLYCDILNSVEKTSEIVQCSLPYYLIYFRFPTFCIEWQLLAGMIAEPAFLSEYTIFALDPTKQPKPQSGSVVSPPTPLSDAFSRGGEYCTRRQT